MKVGRAKPILKTREQSGNRVALIGSLTEPVLKTYGLTTFIFLLLMPLTERQTHFIVQQLTVAGQSITCYPISMDVIKPT